ncbi:MAG: flagellar hook-basal body complex protein FliE [Deltaproteobacteria bacterium]|nr:flagellar hook-basal body complex protein FliE [Deltaproteobacteria bacterium]
MNEVTIPKELPSFLDQPAGVRNQPDPDSVSFGTMLARSLDDVNQLHAAGETAVQDLAAGTQKDIHQTMIALEKADVAFQLLMQVRNKIISAYETIMRMSA